MARPTVSNSTRAANPLTEAPRSVSAPASPPRSPRSPRSRPDFDLALRLLPVILNLGALPAADIYAELAKSGVSEKTAKRAKKALDIRSRQIRRQWHWAMTEVDLGHALLGLPLSPIVPLPNMSTQGVNDLQIGTNRTQGVNDQELLGTQGANDLASSISSTSTSSSTALELVQFIPWTDDDLFTADRIQVDHHALALTPNQRDCRKTFFVHYVPDDGGLFVFPHLCGGLGCPLCAPDKYVEVAKHVHLGRLGTGLLRTLAFPHLLQPYVSEVLRGSKSLRLTFGDRSLTSGDKGATDPRLYVVITPADTPQAVALALLPALRPPSDAPPDRTAMELCQAMRVPYLLRRDWLPRKHGEGEAEEEKPVDEWETENPPLNRKLPKGLGPKKLITRTYAYGRKRDWWPDSTPCPSLKPGVKGWFAQAPAGYKNDWATAMRAVIADYVAAHQARAQLPQTAPSRKPPA